MSSIQFIYTVADHVTVTWLGNARYSIMFSRRVGGKTLQGLMEYGFDEKKMESVLQLLVAQMEQHKDTPDARVDLRLETLADAVSEPVSQITLSIASCRTVYNKILERQERVRQGLERPQQNVQIWKDPVN